MFLAVPRRLCSGRECGRGDILRIGHDRRLPGLSSGKYSLQSASWWVLFPCECSLSSRCKRLQNQAFLTGSLYQIRVSTPQLCPVLGHGKRYACVQGVSQASQVGWVQVGLRAGAEAPSHLNPDGSGASKKRCVKGLGYGPGTKRSLSPASGTGRKTLRRTLNPNADFHPTERRLLSLESQGHQRPRTLSDH